MRMASDYTPRLRIPVFRHSRLLAPRPAGFGAPANRSDFLQKLRCIGRLRLLARTNAEASQTSFVRLLSRCARKSGVLRKRCTRVTHHQLTRYAMSRRHHALRSMRCNPCTGSAPIRCALRPSRLQERNRHASDRRPRTGVTSLLTRRAAAFLFTSYTPRSGVCLILDCPHAAQRCASSPLTRRAAACVFTPHTPRSDAAQRRRAAACVFTSRTPRSGVCLHSSHAAERRASSLHTHRAAACVFTFEQ